MMEVLLRRVFLVAITGLGELLLLSVLVFSLLLTVGAIRCEYECNEMRIVAEGRGE